LYCKYKMSSHFTAPNGEVHNYMTVDVPNSLKSCPSAQSIKARNRLFQLSSTSQAQTSGGLVLFQIPPSNYSISRGTMALRCRITVTGTGLTGADLAHSVSFQGPGYVAGVSTTTPAYGNGYACMSRLTLYGSSSAIIEQTNYCADYMNLMLLHNSNANWLGLDGQVLLGCGASWQYRTDGTQAQIDLVLPIPLSVFNSPTLDWPAYLMGAPLTLQIDLNSVARTLFKGATATITDYSITNTYLVYQAVELPHEFIQAQRMHIKSSPFIMPITSQMNVQVPSSVLTSYTLGLNASSIRAVFVLPANGASYASTTGLNYIRDTADAAADGNGIYWGGSGVNSQLYLDGNVVNSSIFDVPVMALANLKQALHHNLQGSIIYASPSSWASKSIPTWCSQFYMLGFDVTNFDDESSIFSGVPATNVNLQLTGYGTANPTYLNTVIVIYDQLVAFKEDGIIETKR